MRVQLAAAAFLLLGIVELMLSVSVSAFTGRWSCFAETVPICS